MLLFFDDLRETGLSITHAVQVHRVKAPAAFPWLPPQLEVWQVSIGGCQHFLRNDWPPLFFDYGGGGATSFALGQVATQLTLSGSTVTNAVRTVRLRVLREWISRS